MNWLIWSNEHDGWWNPRELGYTKFRSDAGRYDFNRAYEIVSNANRFLVPGDRPKETMCPDWTGISKGG